MQIADAVIVTGAHSAGRVNSPKTNMSQFLIRVVLADDHPMVLTGLLHTLESVNTVEVVATCRTVSELVTFLDSNPCDVIVADYSMPDSEFADGLAMFRYLRRRYPDIGIVALTMMRNAAIIGSLMALGIQTVVSKSDPSGHIVTSIHTSYAKGSYLSPSVEEIMSSPLTDISKKLRSLSMREMEVLRLYASGMSISDIATRLNKSRQTISTQKISAMKKLNAKTDVDLLKFAMETSIVADGGNAIMCADRDS
ncbi:response regulator transcription factor [Burkholderia territorii]|nr:response regulator transcription factor [Burkholderia territorii]